MSASLGLSPFFSFEGAGLRFPEGLKVPMPMYLRKNTILSSIANLEMTPVVTELMQYGHSETLKEAKSTISPQVAESIVKTVVESPIVTPVYEQDQSEVNDGVISVEKARERLNGLHIVKSQVPEDVNQSLGLN